MALPTLLKRTPDKKTLKRIVSTATSQKIRELMHYVVAEGTGKKGAVAGIYIGGKTGTTNYRKSVGRGYQKKDVRTSFIAVFPKNPMYVVLVMLECPKATKKTYGFNTAGWNAAPIAARVIRRMAPLVGLTPSLEDTSKPPGMQDGSVSH
jgi:cell division protein FtsI (penicillin-binding protein 3)